MLNLKLEEIKLPEIKEMLEANDSNKSKSSYNKPVLKVSPISTKKIKGF